MLSRLRLLDRFLVTGEVEAAPPVDAGHRQRFDAPHLPRRYVPRAGGANLVWRKGEEVSQTSAAVRG